MTNIIVVFPKPEEARGIKSILVKNGFSVTAVCTTGAQAMSQVDNMSSGIVVCGYRLVDMIYSDLQSYLPEGFEMLLIASSHILSERSYGDIISLAMPLKVHNLLETVSMMVENMERRKRKRRAQPRERNPEEQKIILEAKHLLMERNNMTEEEAHRYIQKSSMDSGTNLLETSQMVLTMFRS